MKDIYFYVMRLFGATSLYLFAFAFTSSAHASIDYPQVDRFNTWLDAVEKDIKGFTPAESAARLVKSGTREQVFHLEALGRLYREDDKMFNKMRKRFKALEDGIGEWAKWEELLNKAKKNGAPEGEITKLQAKRDAGLIALEGILLDEDFIRLNSEKPDFLTEVRSFVASYPWKPAREDRVVMIQRLRAELDSIKNTQYDFNYLEEGEGIHEFRRDLRWFPMEARALNGMVLLKPVEMTECPIPQYKNLVNDSIIHSKYSKLVPSSVEIEPVLITPCLYLAISKAISDIGLIKGVVESEVNAGEEEASDIADPEDRDAAQAILDRLLTSQLFEMLDAELAAAELEASIPVINLTNPLESGIE